jgi:hypothetical protein
MNKSQKCQDAQLNLFIIDEGKKIDIGGPVISDPPAGHYRVTNMYVDCNTGKLVIEYSDVHTPES